LTLFSVACYTLVDKIAVGQMHPVIFAYVYPWISLSLFSGYIFKAKSSDVLKKEWVLHKSSILVCGVLSIFGYFLILVAFTMERMSYVAGLRQLSIVFAVLLGGHLLKEKNKKIRIASSIIIFLGAYLIAVADR
jgi:drug/metabolite transporter (DMT)-like permease